MKELFTAYANIWASKATKQYLTLMMMSDTHSPELIQMCGTLYGMEEKQINEREEEILKLLNLVDLRNARIGNFSTGQTQRVGLARCLVHNPQYYILDEVTTGLDLMSSQIILNFIKEEKQKGKTASCYRICFRWSFIYR